MSMLVAIARVGAGLRPDRETTCIQQTRSAGDMATLRFFLIHDDRADTGSPPFPGDRNAAAAQGGPAAE